MNDKEEAKKLHEEIQLRYFLEAYAYITGHKLSVVDVRENPDFLCVDEDGISFGIELVKIMRDPREQHWEWIFDRKEEPEFEEIAEFLGRALERKEKARQDRYSLAASRNILIFELTDGNLESLAYFLEDIPEDFVDHGFEEIWLADYSGVEAYGDVELFGLFPDSYWGFHERFNSGRKPYG